MRAPITVVTATIPGREGLLGQALASVYAQTVEVTAHLVMAHSSTEALVPPQHVAQQQNQLLACVATEFTMRLADDDQLLPDHVSTLLPHLEDADVIYTWDAGGTVPRIDCTGWDSPAVAEKMAIGNWIDGSAAVIRTSALRHVGGWPTDWGGGNHMDGSGRFQASGLPAEDWACFYNLARAGAKFLCIPQETWIYGVGDWVRASDG